MTTRDRWVLAYGAALCAAILLLARGLPMAHAWHEDERDSARNLGLRLANARRAIATVDATRSLLAARARQLDSISQRVFVGRASTASAGAASHVSRVARSARVEVSAIQVVLDTAQRGAVKRIGVIASARADIRGLALWIAGLESGPKRYEVVALSIGQPDVAGQSGLPETLSVQLTLRALVLELGR